MPTAKSEVDPARHLRRLRSRIQSEFDNLEHLCARVHVGVGSSPLIREIDNCRPDPDPVIVLYGSPEPWANTVARQLIGEEATGVLEQVPARICIEFETGRGWSLIDGVHSEQFDTQESMHKALGRFIESGPASVRVTLPTGGDRRRLMVVRDAAALAEAGQAKNRLASSLGIAVIAVDEEKIKADPRPPLPPGCVTHFVLASPSDEPSRRAKSLARELCAADSRQIGTLRSGQHPSLVWDLASVDRQLRLVELTLASAMQHFAEAEVRSRARLALAQRTLRLEDGRTRSKDTRSELDRIKWIIDDSIRHMKQAWESSGREFIHQWRATSKQLRNLADQLDETHLHKEVANTEIKLTLDERMLDQFRQGVRRPIVDHIAAQTEAFRQDLSNLVMRVNEERRRLLGQPGDTTTEVGRQPIESEIEKIIQNIASRYLGRMPKRTAMQRLTAGRRPVMVLMMTVSLFGSAFGLQNLRRFGPFAGLMIAIFIFSFIAVKRTWGKEDEDRLNREILRVREELRTEGERAVTDSVRAIETYFSEMAEELRKHVLRSIDVEIKASTNSSTRSLEDKMGGREKLRLLESDVREAQSLQSDLLKLKQTTTETKRDHEQFLRDLLDSDVWSVA